MDKKNTIFLTVIAVATLLVAVVGATFAYFTAQTGSGARTDVNVKTSSTDTLMFDTKPIYLLATQQNFANIYDESKPDDEHAGCQKVVSTSTVDYKKGGPGSKNYCYTVTVNITSNNFGYAPEGVNLENDADGQRKASFTSDNVPELLLKITKKSEKKTAGTGDFTANGDPIIYGRKSNNPLKKESNSECSSSDEAVNADCVYYEHLTGQRKVCTQNNEADPTGSSIQYTGSCNESETPEGFDVTVLNNSSAATIPNHGITQFVIPNADGGTELKHTLTATNEGDEVKDTWTAELVFVNYNWDQQYNASTTEIPKKFVATWNFATVECEP